LALAIIPSIIAMMIMLIGSNVARAFSLAELLRLFALEVKKPLLRILLMYFCNGAGLACGVGFWAMRHFLPWCFAVS